MLPAFALPTISTRNWIFGIRGRGCWLSIAATMFGKSGSYRFNPISIDRSNFLIYRTAHQRRRLNPLVIQPGSAKSILDIDYVVRCIHNVPKQFTGITTHYQVGRATGVPFSSYFSVLVYSIPPADSVLWRLEILSPPPRVHPPVHRTFIPDPQPPHSTLHV